MARCDNFRAQHNELVEIVGEISKLLNEATLSKDAGAARALLSKLSGKLKIHLAMEDKQLYPQMLESKDPKIKEIAKKFSDEMGPIGGAFLAYMSKWPNPEAIQANAKGFITETKGLFEALGKRIQKENTELYVTADKM